MNTNAVRIVPSDRDFGPDGGPKGNQIHDHVSVKLFGFGVKTQW